MKKQRINQKRMTRTGRICFSTACLMILASCAAKPIEQDLASGDATVEIKYLDSMTVDIIDDIRTQRREFYKDALKGDEYKQGIQGSIDREATIAAAINANAQRDQSVLERYSAEGSRQLSALENSEEMNDELLEHNKKLIQQTNELNDTKVSAAKNQAEASAELDNVKVEAVKALLEDYNANMDVLDKEIAQLQEEKESKNNLIKDLDAKIASNPSSADVGKLEKQKGGLTIRVEAIPDEIEKISGKKNEAFTKVTTMLGGSSSNQITIGTGLLAGKDPAGAVALDADRFKTFIDNTTGIEYKWEADANGLGQPGWVNNKKYETNITQHPQAPVPDVPGYLTKTLEKLEYLNTKIEKLAKADPADAIKNTKEVSAPPIERVRNDEAVLDYLLDGYRDTQISSGAEYGGMVRRVLPFSFVFTPGSSTKSGFGARVVLKHDDEQINEAIKMIRENFEHINQSRTVGYMQLYAQAEKESGQLTRNLLQEEYDSKCRDVTSAFQHQTNFHQKFKEVFDSQANKPSFASPQKFWNAYSASMEAFALALKKPSDQATIISNASYTYDLSKVMSGIKSSIANVKKLQNIPHSTDLTLERPDLHDSSLAAAYASCVVSKQLEKEISLQKNSDPKHNAALDKLLEEINQLVMAMTSAGLVHEVYLQNNPKYQYHTTGTHGKTIEVVESALCSQSNADRCYQAVSKEFPYGNLEQEVRKNAKPRIIQNTSREHVVEIADTAKMNTLLAAAVTANEVTDKLGLNIGGEIAAALSSASAFIKRIPYAVPFTGQSFSIEKKNQADKNQNENQIFGWKYYKTPSGATQMGSVTHSFKTTPLNSAVVVSMPEWMSKLTAEYEISPDGKNWVPVGKEKIILSGAAVRSRLTDVKAKPFNTWVKYNIYQDGDASLGLPKLTSCYKKEEKIIFGSSTGETAICGENLYGVKGVLIGGKFIDEGIEKISNNLIKVKKIGLGPDDCPSGSASTCTSNSKCRVVLLSDFGGNRSEDNYCLEIRQPQKPESSVASEIPDGDIPIPKIVNLQVEDNVNTNSNQTNTFKFKGDDANKVKVKSYSIGELGNYTDYHHTHGFTLKNSDLVRDYCMGINNNNKESRSCTIPVHGNVEITFDHIGSKEYLNQPLGSIDMYQLGIWTPYPGNAAGLEPKIDDGAICETGANTNCSFQITNMSWETGKPYSLRIGTQPIYDISATTTNGLTCTPQGSNVTCTATRNLFKTWCGGVARTCDIGFRYQYHDKFEKIGEIKIQADPTVD